MGEKQERKGGDVDTKRKGEAITTEDRDTSGGMNKEKLDAIGGGERKEERGKKEGRRQTQRMRGGETKKIWRKAME